jgi:hypothetical protein
MNPDAISGILSLALISSVSFSLATETRTGFPIPNEVAIPIRPIQLSQRIFLTRRLYTGQNPDSYEYDRAHRNPVWGDVHQVCCINQAADHDRKPYRIKAK